jgi:20S proteasome subunit beta 1
MERRGDRQLREEQCAFLVYPILRKVDHTLPALSLAMSRDGSSGGVIRMCVITEDGVERKFVPGNQLPKFWEGHEVLGKPASLKTETGPAPMAVEPV